MQSDPPARARAAGWTAGPFSGVRGRRAASGEDEELRTGRVGGRYPRASVVWRLEDRVKLEGHTGGGAVSVERGSK